MRRMRMIAGGLAVAAGLVAGCDNGPPGGGITNGPAPDLSADKQSFRTDGPERSRIDQGEMKGAGGTAGAPADQTGSPTGGGGTSSGTGGKGGGIGGVVPAKDPAPRTGDARKDTVEAVGSAGAQPPKEGTAPGSAAGGTKPAGDIKSGTPKGPQ